MSEGGVRRMFREPFDSSLPAEGGESRLVWVDGQLIKVESARYTILPTDPPPAMVTGEGDRAGEGTGAPDAGTEPWGERRRDAHPTESA